MHESERKGESEKREINKGKLQISKKGEAWFNSQSLIQTENVKVARVVCLL